MAELKLDHPNAATDQWDALARELPHVTVGTSCVKLSYKVGKKSFLFIGAKESEYSVMLKVSDSIAEAESMAASEPGVYSVGKFGWITMKFPQGHKPPPGLIERWIVESFKLSATKKILAELTE